MSEVDISEKCIKTSLTDVSEIWTISGVYHKFAFSKDIALLKKRIGVFWADVRKLGPVYAWTKVVDYLTGYRYVYDDAFDRVAIEQTIHQFPAQPLVSILMPVYATDVEWLKRAVASVQAQLYKKWQLCIVDDCSSSSAVQSFVEGLDDERIAFFRLRANMGISGATEKAREMAGGEYITLLDHDDELTPDALFEMVKTINIYDPDVIYSDEDTITQDGSFLNGHFKPDFLPELLLAHNYITHMLLMRASLLDEVGGFRSRYDGAQDYDLVLRLSEAASRIAHISKVLYHWRYVPTSVSRRDAHSPKTDDAGRRAVEDALARRKQKGTVASAGIPNHYHVHFNTDGAPRVSVIISNVRQQTDVEACMRAMQKNADYENLECIVASSEESYAAGINKAAAKAGGEYLVLLSASVLMQTPGWVRMLLAYAQNRDIGCVGGKLITQDNEIYAYGGLLDTQNQLHLAFHGLPLQAHGYFNRLMLPQNVSVVPTGFLMIKKAVFIKQHGFNEELSNRASVDVAFFSQLSHAGLRHVIIPYCVGVQTRGDPVVSQVDAGARNFLSKSGDPFYNPNLDKQCACFRYARPGSANVTTYGIWESPQEKL